MTVGPVRIARQDGRPTVRMRKLTALFPVFFFKFQKFAKIFVYFFTSGLHTIQTY
jgi:hypothetical protein